MTLYLDLQGFANTHAGAPPADSELLKRVNRRVATYYLAVPLAGEDNRVTVATAYPENAAALRVLERLLKADIVAVSSSENELHEAIARIYPDIGTGEGAIMAWTDDPAWAGVVIEMANAFGRAAGRPVIILDSSETVDEVMSRGEYDFSLLVVRTANDATLERLVRRSPISLLVVRGDYAPIDHVLVALRGYGSDREALDRVSPFLTLDGAGATFLPLSRPDSARTMDILRDNSPAREHLREFLRDLDRKNIQVDVRLSQGDPASQIVAELAAGHHNMLVVAAEAEGDFVWQVLSRIESEGVWPSRPVLVVKPPVWPDANCQ